MCNNVEANFYFREEPLNFKNTWDGIGNIVKSFVLGTSVYENSSCDANSSNCSGIMSSFADTTDITSTENISPGSINQAILAKRQYIDKIDCSSSFGCFWKCVKDRRIFSANLYSSLYSCKQYLYCSILNSGLVSRLYFYFPNQCTLSKMFFDADGSHSTPHHTSKLLNGIDSKLYQESKNAELATYNHQNLDQSSYEDNNIFTINGYMQPLLFSSEKLDCNLEVNGISLKLYDSDHSSYSFSSDDECDKRNRRVDAKLLEEEREEHNSNDYQLMLKQVEELDGVFPADHISPYYTVLHFQEVHQTEGDVISDICLQMKQVDCFQPVIAKYDLVHLLLQFKENRWINDVRKAIRNKTASSALVQKYHEFQNVLITRKLILRSKFYNVSHYSDSAIYCDGCDVPPLMKNISVFLNYPNGLLIRKFVGNEEVEYIETSRCGS